MNFFLLLALISLPMLATAQVAETEKFAELDAWNPKEPVTSAKGKQDANKQLDGLKYKNDLNAAYTRNFYSYSQESNGVNYDFSTEQGNGVQLNYRRWLQWKKNAVVVDFLRYNADIKETAALGGNKVSVLRQRLVIASENVFESAPSLDWKLGLGGLTQYSGRFTTNQLINDFNMAGPVAGIFWNWAAREGLNLKVGVEALWGLHFEETRKRSGYHKHSWNLLGSLKLAYQLNRALAFEIGLLLEREYHSFEGTGERGAPNAKNTFTNVAVPIGFSYAF